jgi:hypothetical protein
MRKPVTTSRARSAAARPCPLASPAASTQIVSRDIHSLEAGNRTVLGRGDAFLQIAHLGSQSRLITDRAWGTAQECGYLGTSLREAENIIDKQKHVLVFLVSKILSHGERGKRDSKARTRGLIHLAIHESNAGARFDNGKTVGVLLWMALFIFLNFDDLGFDHFIVKIVALTRPLTDSGKHRDAAMQLRDVINQFHDDDRLANTGPAERANFSTLQEGTDEINNLDAGGQHLR